MSRIALVLIASLATACATTLVETKPNKPTANDLALAKAAVIKDFKDPGSAQFRSLVGYRTETGHQIICGQVNGKNSFGGYVGFTTFYVRLEGKIVRSIQIDDNDSYFLLATYACEEAAKGAISIAVPTDS